MYDNILECEAYACYLKNEKDLARSTSGGAFYAFAKYVIKKGGVVFGAAFQDDFEVCHIVAETLADLEKLQKSKYVQSRIGDTYIQARTLLEDGRMVLYSGTPCQIAGLKSFLGREYDMLLTVDLICHGVPSNKLLQEHISQLQDTYGTLEEIQFRDKQNGWGNVSVSYQLKDEKKVLPCYEDAYFYGFDHYYFLRPSCYECQYRRMKSGSDITVGDYWGIQKEHPDFTNENKGISCIIIKSEKGARLFQDCKNQFVYCKSTVQKIANYNVWVIGTPGRKRAREKFFDQWRNGKRDLSEIYQKIEEKRECMGIGIIGSYSSRTYVNAVTAYDPAVKLQWQAANSGICSMVAECKAGIDIFELNISNAFRKQSLEFDLEKKLMFMEAEAQDSQYIVIDFLEERYPLLFLKNDSVITESEAYGEIEDQVTLDLVKRMTIQELSDQYWEKCCDRLIKILKELYKPEQIILNCLYLAENYGCERPEHSFGNLSEIRQINEKLKSYYQYFIDNFPGIHVINSMDPEQDYCHVGWAYTCDPVYYNRELLCKIRNRLIEIVEDRL